jgi:hypothetical protein
MDPFKMRGGVKPETILQNQIISFLRMREWFVKSTQGNLYQSGFPDLFCCHSRHGARWVEVKLPTRSKSGIFTNAQLDTFPKIGAHGGPTGNAGLTLGVWVMQYATEDEYTILFKPCNWYVFL